MSDQSASSAVIQRSRVPTKGAGNDRFRRKKIVKTNSNPQHDNFVKAHTAKHTLQGM